MALSSPLAALSRQGIEPPTLIGMSAVVMWSATIALYRAVTEIFGPIGGSALIFTAGAIVAVIHAGPSAFRGFSKRYFLLGGSIFVAYEIALALAVGYADGRQQAMEVGMINYLWPTFTIALAVIMKVERADWRMIPGLALSLFGIIWLSSGDQGIDPGQLIANVSANPLPYALALFAALSWPVYTLLTRAISGGKNGVPAFLVMTAAAVWLKYAFSDEPALPYDLRGFGLVAVFGVLTTLAYSAWNHGVLHGRLTLLATASYFAPVLSVLCSSLLLAMMPSASFWAGAMLVTIGSLVCWLSTRRQN